MERRTLLSLLTGGGESFGRALALDPDEIRELVPMTTSGPHAVSVSLETGMTTLGMR